MSKSHVRVRRYQRAGGILRFTAYNRAGEPIHENDALVADVRRWLAALPPDATHLPMKFYDNRERRVPLTAILAVLEVE